jgi:hypothetical protein
MNQGTAPAVGGVMAAALKTGLFVSRVTIEAPDGLFVDGGQPSGNYAPVAGGVAIRCMASPVSDIRITASETKTVPDVQSFAPRHVLLDARYAALETGFMIGWRATLDDEPPSDITGVDHDSQGVMTRLALRRNGV